MGLYSFALGALLTLCSSVCLAGDIKAGRAKALMCQTCHGIDGLSKVPDAPNIAGQTESYLVGQIASIQVRSPAGRGDVVGRICSCGPGHRGPCRVFFGD
jgi:cytochrome c553